MTTVTPYPPVRNRCEDSDFIKRLEQDPGLPSMIRVETMNRRHTGTRSELVTHRYTSSCFL